MNLRFLKASESPPRYGAPPSVAVTDYHFYHVLYFRVILFKHTSNNTGSDNPFFYIFLKPFYSLIANRIYDK